MQNDDTEIKEENNADVNDTQNSSNVMSKFDEAFNKSSKEVQDYILSEEFPDNIKLICKLQKLEDEKENVIIENIAVSIMVGLLSTADAKNTLIESFKSSGILIEELSAQMILKDIDVYILSHIRKQILQSKIINKEIRHLTLKEEKLEKEKEELRKILLANTGNINGRGGVFEYEKKEISIENPLPTIEKGDVGGFDAGHNRESLLAKININPGELSDTEKLKDRMRQIKDEEMERLNRLEKEKEIEIKERLSREMAQKEIDAERLKAKEEQNLEKSDMSEIMKERIEQKIESGEKDNFDLEKVIKKRELEELEKEKFKNQRKAEEKELVEASLDPYRENV